MTLCPHCGQSIPGTTGIQTIPIDPPITVEAGRRYRFVKRDGALTMEPIEGPGSDERNRALDVALEDMERRFPVRLTDDTEHLDGTPRGI